MISKSKKYKEVFCSNIFNKKLFIELSQSIKKKIMQNIKLYNNYSESIDIYNDINLCKDSERELYFLKNIINIVKENNPEYCNKLIYLVVLYVYYALVLLEQTHDYLDLKNIKSIAKISHENAINLFFEITISDKEYCSKIRKIFFMFE